MRRLARALLLLAAFTIPWEYSLDFGPPLGNIARLAIIAVFLAMITAILQAGTMRKPGPLQILVLLLFLWFCCGCFWTIDRAETLHHLRGYIQEFILVWLVWELVDSPENLLDLLRAYLAGAFVLAAVTVGSFLLSSSADQVRFFAENQDPNDVARFLDLAFPLAALLFGSESRWPGKLLAATYVPFGILAVLLTASRSGFLEALIALTGSAVLILHNHRRAFTLGFYALPAVLAAIWFAVPRQTLERLATIPGELTQRDLNQRWEIWAAGWQAFVHAPLLGSGAGSFVAAAGLAPIDTAHNTALALLVEGGIVAILIATAIVITTASCALALAGTLRLATGTALLTLLVGSIVATVHENRATWLLLGIVALAARLHAESPKALLHIFPTSLPGRATTVAGLVTQE
ncbi:O-antigen ligase family protein [Occallatibacter riparius]|uniref:O-antigen ligase family protein n=1 Tax=Occallatibacter riparius TaxID=1002689 RepID=A0A9J7BM98_9BACT|nr:O-antigen ligase family protein [Occallatibacter riparius]UWZ82890.1 O-antigen ligase family protein [Occallatibacter riparius]